MVKALALALTLTLSACASARVPPPVDLPAPTVATPVIPPLPFPTVASLPDDGDYRTAQCPNGQLMAVGEIHGRYKVIGIPPRFLMIDFDKGVVWLGMIEDQVFQARQYMTLEEVKLKYPSPCEYLTGGPVA